MRTSGSRTRPKPRLKPAFITIDEARQVVPLGTTKYGELLRSGELESEKIAGRRLIRTEAFEKYFGVEVQF